MPGGWRARLAEDLDSAARRDPAARGRLEILLCYPGLHAIWMHRLVHRMWQHDGLKPPKVVTAATESYVESQDICNSSSTMPA